MESGLLGAVPSDDGLSAPALVRMSDVITSVTNAKVKHLVRLRNRRYRDDSESFVIEGYRELSRAVAAGIAIEELYACEPLYLGSNEPSLVDDVIATGARLVRLDEAPFRKAAYRDRPEGLLAVAAQFDTALANLIVPSDPLILVVESIEKPGNLGTMMRTADAAGVHAVVVADATTDPFNPNVVRASIGSVFTVPLAIASTNETLAWMGGHDVRPIVTTPDASVLYWDADFRGSVAVVIGSEQYGLTDPWLDIEGAAVRIPMVGTADSLNAAMATGVTLFEAIRQRTAAEG